LDLLEELILTTMLGRLEHPVFEEVREPGATHLLAV
jgi:hypothetical protein